MAGLHNNRVVRSPLHAPQLLAYVVSFFSAIRFREHRLTSPDPTIGVLHVPSWVGASKGKAVQIGADAGWSYILFLWMDHEDAVLRNRKVQVDCSTARWEPRPVEDAPCLLNRSKFSQPGRSSGFAVSVVWEGVMDLPKYLQRGR